ncbi:Ultraviolet-B receptor UVR8 [Glycine soja]|uniref:Uncharacterized protein n=2 Tax=Glycine subgen. Soja TaxID=1462606 RepID=K7L477_SOYBN|nr:Ultraviolet-B receptor UVR8 [Glycine soja]
MLKESPRRRIKNITGNVVCSWGRVEDGQLGHGDTDDRLLPTKLSALDGQDIICVTCGADHTMARSESGRDGRNQNGELGLGTTEDSLLPQKIQKFEGIPIKMVAAGAEHSVAITEDGNLYGWGWGRYGNLGLDGRKYVILNLLGDKMAMVACGWRHTRCVSSSGGLYTTGWGKYGQLGHGNFEDHLVPRKVQALSDKFISQDFFLVSGGWRHSMALTSNYCSPMQVNFPHDQKVRQISCGWRHTIAVTERENVYSWGRGANGQLWNGETIDPNVPMIIKAFSVDGSSGQHIESSKPYPTSGKSLSSISKRYAIAPDETASGSQPTNSEGGDRHDTSVP